MDLYTYLFTNVLETFAEILGVRNHHVNVVVAAIGAGVIALGPGLGHCVIVFEVVPSLKSVESPCVVFAPG